MGQNDIYQFLKKNGGKWFTSKEISGALDIGSSSVSTCLKRLRNHKTIFFKQGLERKGMFVYKIKYS